jgi:hypothetical protein
VTTASSTFGLHLFFRCGEWVMAVEAEPVERIVGGAGLRLTESRDAGDPASAHPACLGLADTGDAEWAAWDLGLMLDAAPTDAAWLLIRRVGSGDPLRLALRVGRCVNTGRIPLDKRSPVSAGIARFRRNVLPSAFPAGLAGPGAVGALPVGMRLDLSALWSFSELSASKQMLDRAAQSAATGYSLQA